MVEAEIVISHLRGQVRDLEALLNYLESRDVVGREEYGYLNAKLHEVIGRLKEMRRSSSQHGARSVMHAPWLN